jgi:5-methylcytosine-specific restriction endonuclease McrA
VPDKIRHVRMPVNRVQTPYRGPRVYGTARWRKLRLVKLRANPLCEYCLAIATQVDHKDGNARNMAFDNLQSLCQRCHSKKTVAQDGGLGKKPKHGNT